MEIIKKNPKHQNISPNKKLLVQVSYKITMSVTILEEVPQSL